MFHRTPALIARTAGLNSWPLQEGLIRGYSRATPARRRGDRFRRGWAGAATVATLMGSLIKKRRKRMRKKKHKKMLKRTRFQRRAKGK